MSTAAELLRQVVDAPTLQRAMAGDADAVSTTTAALTHLIDQLHRARAVLAPASEPSAAVEVSEDLLSRRPHVELDVSVPGEEQPAAQPDAPAAAGGAAPATPFTQALGMDPAQPNPDHMFTQAVDRSTQPSRQPSAPSPYRQVMPQSPQQPQPQPTSAHDMIRQLLRRGNRPEGGL